MKRAKGNVGVRLIGVVAALLVGAAQAQTAQTTIKMASLSPLSGPQSDVGTQISNGARLAVNEYQGQFAKLGLNLSLQPYDDQADPTTGTAAARKIIADSSILALVGPLNSGVAIPVSVALAPSHVALVSPSATANVLTERGLKNTNRIVPRDDAQGPAGADFMLSKLKAKKVYMLNDKTAYGEGLAGEVEKALRAKGVQIVGSEGTEEKSNFGSIIQKISLSKPDVIYFGGVYSQVGVFAKQLREKGITIPLVGGDAYDSADLLSIAGAGANNIYFTTIVAPASEVPAAKPLAALYQKTFGKPIQGFGIFGYDAAKVVLQGMLDAARSGKASGQAPTRAQVENAIRRVRATGLMSGTVQFNSVGDRRAARMYIMKVNQGKVRLETTLDVKAPRP